MSETAVRTVAGIDLPAAGTWTIDPIHTTVGFSARHLMLAKVRGGFKAFQGTIHVEDDAEASWVETTLDAASIDTGNQMRDDHLRSADFLDVATFPTLSFRSSRLERTGDRTFTLTGDLTIRDVTRPVTLDVEYLGAARDPYGNDRVALTATAEIDRDEFGITYNQVLETGGVVVGKKISLDFDIQAVRS
ncbi:MAG TPA: YceI family protein [Actinomycetota bacterium]|nr:YceI family protein [Actinomycetota bacterium]